MFVFSFIISLFLLQAPASSIATNSPVEETVKSKMKTEQSYDLLASRYEDVLSAYDRLEKELTRNLTIISIIVALFGVLVPLLLVFYSSRDIDKTIKAHARRNEEFTKKVETFALQTAHNLEEYKKQNQIRELMNKAEDEEDLNEAISCYSSVIELDSNNKLALIRRAKLYKKQKEYSEAIKDFKRVIEIDPNYFIAYSLLGLTYFMAENYEEAEKCYRNVLAINPSYPIVFARLANVYYAKKDYEKGLEYIDKAISLENDNIIYHKRRLKILKGQNIVGNVKLIKEEEEIIKKLDAEL